MTHAERYAKKLQRDYGIEPADVKLDDVEFDTVDKVAAEILPPKKYRQWRKDFTAEVDVLREKYGIGAQE